MRVDVPFIFGAYGSRGKRVVQQWRVLGNVRTDVPEISSAEVDGTVRMRWDEGGFSMPVVDGTTFMPMVFPQEGYRIGTAEDYRTVCAGLALGEYGFLQTILGCPIIDGREIGCNNMVPVPQSSIREIVPSGEPERRRLAEELGSLMLSIDGVLHTSRWEPSVEPGVGGLGWGLADVSDHCRNNHAPTRRPGFMRDEETVGDDAKRLATGDLGLVRWRYDNGPGLVAEAARMLGRLVDAEWSNFPTNQYEAPALFEGVRRYAADFRRGLPIDVDAARREIAEAVETARIWLSPESSLGHVPDYVEGYLERLAERDRGLARMTVADDDLDAFAALTP